jgi:NADH dehydrogenase FAD-containing subunit
MKTKNIVILGASFAGIGSTHRILKHAPKNTPIKLILISPNTHFYWNIATPRAIVPEQLSDERIFQEISPGFKHYPTGQFEFVLGSAEAFNTDAKTVTLLTVGGEKTIDYDILILATGSSVNSEAPFKGLGSTQATKDALHDFQGRVKNARSIVVAGGGPTGIETAGELAYRYGAEKEVTLVSSDLEIHTQYHSK